MGTINKKYNYGWYGSCDSIANGSCQPLVFNDLPGANPGQDDHRKNIESVIRVSENYGDVFEKYTSYDMRDTATAVQWLNTIAPSGKTFDDYINPTFKQMECGVAYLITTRTDNPQDFDIAEFNMADGTAWVATDCADVTVCTEANFLSYQVGPSKSAISDQANGVSSSAFTIEGELSIPPRDSNNYARPYAVDVKLSDGTFIGHVTYSGEPSVLKMYFKKQDGSCLTGTITGNLCQLA